MTPPLKTLVRTDKPPIVFVSYSHKDEAWKDALLPHLRSLEKLGTLEVWNDRDIKAGVDWYAEIKDVLSRTKVAICLISSNFLSSSFCLDEEVAYLLQARNRGDLEILPVLVEDCVWQPHRWLKRLQMLPRDGHNVTTHFSDDPAQVFSEVANQTYEMLQPGYVFERPPSPETPPERIDIKRLPQTGDLLFGRREEMDALDGIWNDDTLNIAVFKASGGVGKSSLVRAWVEDMALDNYRGAERVYAWSFYSQGTQERVTSADEFISHALGWFGDETKGEGKSPWDRGQRLAELIQEKRTLLLLDGLEPLQSGQAFDRGKIKDPGLEVLLDELGRDNPGLCLISTREEVSDLWHDRQACQVDQFDLDTISTTAGRAPFRVNRVEGEDAALEQAVKDFGQHAYAVKLLGSFLTWSGTPHIDHAADIPDLPDIEEKEGKHPRRVMAAFAEHFGDSAKADILAMLGLFDRPADAGCIAALRKGPAVPGLNAAVLPISEATWQEQIAELRKLGLLTPESHHALGELDAHPLVREHFGTRLRDQRERVWKTGHERLYEHLQTVPEEYQPDALVEIAPLFQAIHHGCMAKRFKHAFYEIYTRRIQRGIQIYHGTHVLGTLGSDLAALSSFFGPNWSTKPEGVDASDDPDALRLYNQVGYRLLALGRLEEAIVVNQKSYDENRTAGDHNWLAMDLANLADVRLLLGDIKAAISAAHEILQIAEGDVDRHVPFSGRLRLAQSLQADGSPHDAVSFLDMEFNEDPRCKKYTHFKMSNPRRLSGRTHYHSQLLVDTGDMERAREVCQPLIELNKADPGNSHDQAFDALTLGWLALKTQEYDEAKTQLSNALVKSRSARRVEILLKCLLANASLACHCAQYDASSASLEEAMRLAKRCGMRLFECDAHLEFARLEIEQGQPDAARGHVKAADALVTACGYHRRDGEVAELKEKLGL